MFSWLVVERITDKGMLMLDTVESGVFKDWIKERSGETAEALWRGSAGLAWAYAKRFLEEKGLHLPI